VLIKAAIRSAYDETGAVDPSRGFRRAALKVNVALAGLLLKIDADGMARADVIRATIIGLCGSGSWWRSLLAFGVVWNRGRPDLKTLIVQIKCKLGEAYEVAAFVADHVPQCQVYSISGAYDLLAIVNLEDLVDPGVFVNKRLHGVPGIVETNTMIAFNAFTPSKKV